MVIFHSYVKLPEGSCFANRMINILSRFWFSKYVFMVLDSSILVGDPQCVTTNSLHIECLHCNKQCNQGFISQIREKTWERPVSCVDIAREWSNSSFHLVNDEYSFQCVYKYIYIHMYNKATACICWIGINVGLPKGTHLCIHTYAYIIYDYILYIWYVFNFIHNITSCWKQKQFYLVMAFLWSCFSYCAASVFAPRTRHDQCDRLDQLREEKERPDPAAGPADDWRVDADISMFFFHPCVNHPYFDGHPFILQLGMVYYICVMLVKQCRKPSPIVAFLGGIETYWNRIKHDKTI